MDQIEAETNLVLASLVRIKEVATLDIIDAIKRAEQSKRIDKLVASFVDGHTLEKSYQLTKEEFGGSFGILLEDSKLLAELRKHNELVKQLSTSIKQQILEEHLLHQKFQSNPLVEYEERHGGPLWYELSFFTFEFKHDNSVDITIDTSLSKRMTPQKGEVTFLTGEFKTIVIQPNYLTGQIKLSDGRRFNFESLYGKMDYIYLESPQIWKESIVLRSISINNRRSVDITTFI